jgi:ubiquinone biosynthesis O-methyltransferase
MFLNHCAAMLKPGGLMLVSTINRNWKSFALAIVGAIYVLRWLPRSAHRWNKFVTPDELARHLADSKLAITEEAGVVYNPFADKWGPRRTWTSTTWWSPRRCKAGSLVLQTQLSSLQRGPITTGHSNLR